MINNETMDCALLSYQGKNYLLPMLTIAHLVAINDMQEIISNKKNGPIFGEYCWQDGMLPVVAIDLLEPPLSVLHPKLAIVHTLFSHNQLKLSSAALLFEGTPKRIKIRSEQLRWVDEKLKRAVLHGEDDLEVTIFDLNAFSNTIENLLHGRDPQIPK